MAERADTRVVHVGKNWFAYIYFHQVYILINRIVVVTISMLFLMGYKDATVS